jgi:hypothetical protein
MRQALDVIARLLTNNLCDAMTLDWAALRYKHTAALRAVLTEKYAPATANKILSALRRVLKEALRLELMDAKDFARAVDIKTARTEANAAKTGVAKSMIYFTSRIKRACIRQF